MAGLGLLLGSVATVAAQIVHPGCLSTQTDLNRIASKVGAGAQPWKGSWDRLVNNTNGWLNHTPEAVSTINVGGGGTDNYIRLARDCARAYQLSLRYHGDGSTWAANKSVQIMNTWASTHTGWSGDTNISLRAGLYGYQFACAAELMRGYSGWNPVDFAAFQSYMLNQFYGRSNDFLTRHHDTVDGHYWANWDLATLASMMAIGVLCDDQAIFDKAIDYFHNGGGTGNIKNAVPYVHPNGLGQWQESGRDQGHSIMGPQLMGVICEIAWNQGVDLYGAENNRFLASVEYISKYNLWQDVPFAPFVRTYGHPVNEQREVHWNISSTGRGAIRPGWDLVYHHYVNRMGMAAPYTADYAAVASPEGGGFNYGPNSGGFDGLGFTTLTHSRDPIASDAAPRGLRTTQNHWQVTLSWWGSASATSYNVKRATTSGGPYATIATVGNQNLFYVDAGLTAGTTYHYVVSANTPGGETANSSETSVIAIAAGGDSYQAEVATYGGGASLQTWTSNHHGTGSVVPMTGGWIEFTGIDGGAGGPVTLGLRYALGSGTRTGGMTVNGVQQSIIADSTGDWDNWFERYVTVTLNSGTNNTIRIESDGTNNFVYVDELTVKNSTAAPTMAVPAAPEGLTVSIANASRIDLSWNAVADATSYYVKRAVTSGGPYVVLDHVTGTSYSDKGTLQGGTTYYYVVTALNEAGESAGATETGASMAPTDLTATALDQCVTLGWSAAASGCDLSHYNVWRSTTPGSGYVQLATGVTSSAYADHSATNGVAYYYVVTAVNAGGTESAQSNEIMAIPSAIYQESGGILSMEAENGSPGARWQTGTDTGASNGAYVEVNPSYDWAGSSPEGSTGEYLVHYNFQLSTSGNYRFWFRILSNSAADDSFFWRVDGGSWNMENGRYGNGSWFSTDDSDINDLSAGNHSLQISYRENGTRLDKFVLQQDSLTAPSGNGPAESSKADVAAPAVPAGLSATASDSSVALDWDDSPEADLTGYTVYRSTTSGNGYSVLASGLTSSEHTDGTAANGTTYYYVVTATDDASNESSNCAEVSASPADTTPPAAPGGLSATAGDASVTLDWADNAEPDLAGYTVYRSTTIGNGYSAIASGLSNSAFTDGAASNGVTYYYVVTATDDASNESAKSAETSATAVADTALSVTATLPGVNFPNQSGPALATSASFDMAGGNAVALLVTSENGSSSDVISATFAGQPMTLGVSTSQGVQWAGIFYLINPTTTSGQFVVSTTGSLANGAYSAVAFAKVGGVADIDAVANTSTGGTISLVTTTATDGGYVLGAAVNNGWNSSNPPPSFVSGDADQILRSPVLVGTSGHLHTYGEVTSAGSSTNVYGNLVQRNAYVSLTFDSVAFPSPWQSADIGAVAAAGRATHSNGTYSVEGSGADIWGSADEFHYAYQTASGDCEIVARVSSVENTSSWAKAGVMIRESLNANSRHAMVIVTPTQGVAFQRRTSTGGISSNTSHSGLSAPYWVRLVRSGDTFSAYRSADGSNWTSLGSQTIAMSANVYLGLAVCSNNDGTLCTAGFGNVTATP